MQVINRKGEVFNVDGDVVPDGCSLRTNIFMLDSGLDDTQREIARSFSRPVHFTDALGRANQPGHRYATSSGVLQDATDAADAARTTRKKLLSDAWRTADALNEQGGGWQPTRSPDLVPFKPTPDADPAGNLSAAYLAAKQRASNAWRSPAGPSSNPAEPKARVFEKNWAASFAPYEADAADAAHAEMTRRVCDAWRVGT